MGHPQSVEDFPDGAQRRAVCEKQAKIRGRGAGAADRDQPELPAEIRLGGTVAIIPEPEGDDDGRDD